VISLFGAVTQFVIMFILGVPLALPLAVLSFFGGFIPYIGSFITTGLAFLVTLALGSTEAAAVMLVYTLVFNIVTGNFVAPIVYGRAVNIHPAIVLLAIPAGAALAGIAGMFLVVPIIGVIATTWRMGLRVFADGPVTTAPDGGAAGPATDPPLPPPAMGEAGS
jgi:predicted PurR-regulated permease PerM